MPIQMKSKTLKKSAVNNMWGGHFVRGPAEAMARINECLDTDKRLYAEDIAASIAHATMLSALATAALPRALSLPR